MSESNSENNLSKNKNLFKTNSFYPSAFLIAKGLSLVGIERADPKRANFVFQDRSDRQQLIQAFNFAEEDSPEVMVDVRKFVVAVRVLKDRLYQRNA